MAGGLFGTDGVRGPAGTFISEQLAFQIGYAAAVCAKQQSEGTSPRFLVIRDTRESGEGLEAAFAKGCSLAGCEALIGGVLPTPAAPQLQKLYGFEFAGVISASHNPWQDNGIKIFGPSGRKLTDEFQDAVSQKVEQLRAGSTDELDLAEEKQGLITRLLAGDEDFIAQLTARFSKLDLSELSVVLDTANGATSTVAPRVFEALGATVTTIGDAPNGRNINDGVGSTHPETAAALVKEAKADLGFAFDGDGDRVMAIASDGQIVDGDGIIAEISFRRKLSGQLEGGIALTVMSNFGLQLELEKRSIPFELTAVGDRYVTEALDRQKWQLGGEQSGHIIDTSWAPSGDGIASALLLLEALNGAKLKAGEAFVSMPQTLINVKGVDKSAIEAQSFQQALKGAELKLAGQGRVLVRPSGTEPLVRVMVEASSAQMADQLAAELAESLKALTL